MSGEKEYGVVKVNKAVQEDAKTASALLKEDMQDFVSESVHLRATEVINVFRAEGYPGLERFKTQQTGNTQHTENTAGNTPRNRRTQLETAPVS